MFFRKRREPTAQEEMATDRLPDNHREHYRRPAGSRDMPEFKVRDRSGRCFEGEFVDASIRGTAARFTLAADPGLNVGDAVDVLISCKDRDVGIETPARVVYVEPGGDQHWRYAFEFVSVGNLYAQLDEFYARIFNRRKSQRILIPAEQTVKATLMWGANSMECRVHDLSQGGMSTILVDEKAARMEEVERLRVSVRLPKCTQELSGVAHIRHRAYLQGRVLLGIEFDLTKDDGFRRHQADLEAYISARRDEIERWERAIGVA